jgi:hypothetical protein
MARLSCKEKIQNERNEFQMSSRRKQQKSGSSK